VSVHLGDENGQAAILAIGHGPGLQLGDDVLLAVTPHRVASVGTDSTAQECHAWAVVDLC
jgi:hypothetical protein